MRLDRLEIENFKGYRGEHSIEFPPPTEDRNVYLFGGLNGAGKTSLFTAIALGLYGDGAAGLLFDRSRPSDLQVAYAGYLEDCLPTALASEDHAIMRVKLDLSLGDGRALSVTRQWWFTRGHFDEESLTVYEDGRPVEIDGAEQLAGRDRVDQLQDLLDWLAPPNVAKFFFFDGEEIQRIAERNPDRAVVEGLNQLLGLSLFERLQSDLLALKRRIRKEMPAAQQSGLVATYEAIDQATDELDRLTAEVDAKRGHLATIAAGLEGTELELADELHGLHVSTGDEAADELRARERSAIEARFLLQSLVADKLAFEMLRPEVADLVGEIERELVRRRDLVVHERLRTAWAELISIALSRPEVLNLVVAESVGPLQEVLTPFPAPPPLLSNPSLGVFADEELQAFQRWAISAAPDVDDLRLAVGRQIRSEREAAELRAASASLAHGTKSRELLERKSSLLEARRMLEGELLRVEAEVTSTRTQLAQLKVTRARQEATLSEEATARGQLAVIDRLHAAVTEFMDLLRRERSSALAARISEMMALLAHKEDLVHSVLIDPESFEIRTLDARGLEVRSPSAGEREIFALSMVWGLAEVSEQALPVIIDTPLGRLDHQHRSNIVDQFFPRAGQQVVILSTDTEIDDRYRASLEPRIVEQYLIEFDEIEQRSRVASGTYLHSSPHAKP